MYGQSWLFMGGNRNAEDDPSDPLEIYKHAYWVRRAGFWEITRHQETGSYPRTATEYEFFFLI